MSYLVLARKWRPQRFEDIVGQDHITRILRNAIQAGRIAHAYLFTGVRGVGKTTAARILAKALNCENGPTPDPCNACAHCNEIAGGSSLDVYEIDGASNRGIDEVRQIIENARYQPAKSRFKIYIIDEVHQVTKDAFNALLKTLEEPPSFVKFILATTEPHRLPETILSRCQRFDFRRIQVREIARRLGEIAEKEDLKITDDALLLLAREADGSMRDAQSLLEQILSYAAPVAGEEKASARIDERLLQDILGMAERKALYEFSAAVIRGDAGRCVDLIAKAVSEGWDLVRLSRELTEHFRNLLVVRLAEEKKEETKELHPGLLDRLLDLPEQEVADLRQQAAELSVETLMDYFRFMADGDDAVARSSYPRFALESVLIGLAILPRSLPIVELVDRLEALETKLSMDVITQPLSRSQASAGAGRRVEPPSNPSVDDPKAEVWKKFVAFVMQEKKVLGSYLEQVSPLELPPGRLAIGAEQKHHLNYLVDAENLSSLRDFARRFFSSEVPVTVTPMASGKMGGSDPVSAAKPKGETPDVVQEALRIFGGSLKGVKKENG